MTYDLLFPDRPDRDDIYEWLTEQPNAIPLPERVGFENELTGVYFGFDFPADEPNFQLVLNYVRPHVFGLEPELLVTELVRVFELAIPDPQAGGMGEGSYSPEGFLRGWNAGNRSGYRAALRHGAELWTLPRATNHMVWTWNRAKLETQELFEDDDLPPAFVPTTSILIDENNRVFTSATWTGDMPICIPEGIDALMLPTDEPTPADHHGIGTPALIIEAPAKKILEKLVARSVSKQLGRLPIDKVLDRELVEQEMRS